MKIANFHADADLVGRRIRVSWDFVLESAEMLASIPPVTVRRKTRDFVFPPPPQNGPDPFLVYSSNAFPPPGTTVKDLPEWEQREGNLRTVVTVETASRLVNGVAIEATRRTTATFFANDGTPLRRHIEILDAGEVPDGLTPHQTYYYQIFSPLILNALDPRPYQSTATAGDRHGMGAKMYDSLPSIHRRHDVVKRPVTPGAEAIPEAQPNSGQLRRFIDLFGVALDSMRSSADGLLYLHDVDHVDYRCLPLMARWIGWDLTVDAPIPIQRHEIKYAPALYKITGTIPGCILWVKRLTGWNSRIKEFYRNVFFSNHVSRPDEPTKGSYTVDTKNATLMKNIGKFDDDLDYIYDTGTTQQDWYAYNVVGIFVQPPKNEDPKVAQRKIARLINNMSIFLPFNMRGVVIVDVETTQDSQSEAVDLFQGTNDEEIFDS